MAREEEEMNLTERILALREGGRVERTHTIPHVGEYNVAMHCYNAASLLLMLSTTPPSLNLIKAVLWHDVPERWTGDISAPAKWACPELKLLLDFLEMKIFEKLELANVFKELTTEEQDWLSAVDLLELYIWAVEQNPDANSGNPWYEMRVRILRLFNTRYTKTPKEVWDFIDNFTWKRNPELDELLSETNEK